MAPSSKFDKLPSGFEISPDNSYAVFSKIIEKPENDDRSYRLIHLNNELEALLIHDPETDKSSAALDVHVGQLSDPDNLEGLAHFCEHLLFMGTKKYPKENEYSEYLSNHGGYSNAYTSEDHTNYYFEVAHENLEEFKKNLQSDTIRLYELGRILSSPKHPYKKFGTGNLVTLKDNPLKEGLDIRDELLKFHNNYYSANIMKLVVLGQEPLDQLTQWVVDKFSDINNKSIPAPIFKETPYTKNELMKKVFVKPVKDLIILKIRFPFPVQDPLFRAKPGRYLSHLLGHEGAGSIFSLLKKKGLANSLDAGPGDAGAGFGFFYIDVDLTESGLANYEEIVKIIFQYIKMLKNEGIQEWIYHEAEILSAVSFKFKEKSQPEDYTSELSNALQSSYPREWVLNKSYIFREYNPKLIQESLDWLRPDNFILTLVSQTFTNLDQKEKWYGTEYKVEPMSENFLQELKSTTIDSQLKLPLPNEFIPTNLEIKKQGIITPLKHPNLIKNTDLVRIWYKKDDTFWVPKVYIWFKIQSPLVYTTPSNAVKTRLYLALIEDALNEYSYSAKIAGLYYNLAHDENFYIYISGYNDKAMVLLEKILLKMKNFEVDSKRFDLYKEKLLRGYRNTLYDTPYQTAMNCVYNLLYQKFWTNEEKLSALENIVSQDIQNFYPNLLNDLHIECLVHGNVDKEDSLKYIKIFEDILKPKPLSPSQRIGERPILLPVGKRYVYQRDVYDANDVNSAIEYYIEICHNKDVKSRNKLSILAQIVNQPFFDQIRTKEQLGYLVFNWAVATTGIRGLIFMVQSERDPNYLEHRIEEFFKKLQKIIEEMSDEVYQKQIQSIITIKTEKPKNLYQEAYKYWNHITNGFYEFNKTEIDVEELYKITKSEILDFFKDHFYTTSPNHKKLSVHLKSQKKVQTTKPIDIKYLHSCLNEQGITKFDLKELEEALNSAKPGKIDAQALEKILKTFLVDKTKANEEEIEILMKKISKSYLNGDYESSSNIIKDLNDDDGDYNNKIKENGIGKQEIHVDSELIEDIALWKSSMNLGPTPIPNVDLNNFIEATK
ncbi:14542_t:CDS:10 [Entrophospora sp. SA101]|nr:11428_t:CDS:10 [Entrophospora sp. SA101]CAJ0758064.1 14542_t:CDS:10 [Entrophospora sp. SA101]CAJ0843769.1 15542_t:CDS:10 [Entrophospora sp. SA101]